MKYAKNFFKILQNIYTPCTAEKEETPSNVFARMPTYVGTQGHTLIYLQIAGEA